MRASAASVHPGLEDMFLLNEILLLSPLIVYSFIRILSLFRRPASRVAFAGAFLVLLAAFPVAESLSHRAGGHASKALMTIGYDALPYLMYLVLTVILSDIIIGGGRLLKLVSRESVRGSRFRLARLCLALAVPALVVAAGILNFHWLRVKEYSVDVPRRESAVAGLKVVFASDFHLGALTDRGFMEKFVAKVNALDPDIVLIGGDILEGDRRDEDTTLFAREFRRLHAVYGVYAVPGNHEGYRGGGKEFSERAGILLLEDAVVKVDEAFYLVGRRDARSRNRKPVADLLKDVRQDLPVVLLDHRPTDLEAVSRTDVDIQLSGHTHDGQLFPINWITAREYELSWGHLKKGRTDFFVTSGVQLWGPPVRTAGASEILVIRVNFTSRAKTR